METDLNRESLLKALTLIKPSLAAQSYVPALTHFCCDGEWILGYNDVQSIAVKYDTGLDCCLPGELTLKMLSSMTGQNLAVEMTKGQVLLMCGRSRVRLPTLPVKEFDFQFPTSRKSSFDVNADLLQALERTLLSVGSDPTHPAQLGITLAPNANGSVCYSTDNTTISRAASSCPVKLPGDAPIILPTFFCTQLLLLAKAFPDATVTLELHTGAVVARVGAEAKLFSKLVLDVEPMDFERVLKRHVTLNGLAEKSVAIPEGIDSALDRAELVLSASDKKSTSIHIKDGTMRLTTQSDLGDAVDKLELASALSEMTFNIDPAYMSRAVKATKRMVPLERAVAFGDDSFRFLHLMAHHVGD